MAVDSKQKRLSIMSMGDGDTELPLFEADGTVDLDDRQHLLGMYSGIAFFNGSGLSHPLTGNLMDKLSGRLG